MTKNKKNTNSFDSFMDVVGFFSIAVLAFKVIKEINKKTNTEVISNDAIKVLKRPEEAKKLREAVNEYHRTGDWSKTELESIL